jgi:hypothetical protein
MISLPRPRQAETSSSPRVEPRPALEARVHAEFKELQGLRLSLPQAARLFGLDRTTCQHVLDTLARKRVLKTDAHGNYCLAQLDV